MRNRLPFWARIIIALVIATFVGIAYGVVRLVSLVQEMGHCARDPVKQREVERRIAEFPTPLPNGFVVSKALHLPIPLPSDVLILDHPADNLSLQFWSNDQIDPSEMVDAKTDLDRALDISGNGYPAKIETVKSKGRTNIAKEEMAYIVGEFKDAQNSKLNGMIGCICIHRKEKNKTILIYAMQPAETPYNQEAAMNLLKSIKSF